jgi:type IV secretion system protein VirB8
MSNATDPTLVRVGEQTEFFANAHSWERSESIRAAQSERRAWWVAAGASVIALCAVIGLSVLAPLKQTVPYVYAVDKATGNVELMSVGDERMVQDYQHLLDKHWAQKYVVARESYYWKLLQLDYDTVLMMSNDVVGREYAKQWEGPNARDRKLGSTIDMRVKVLSITLSSDEHGSKATVRFEKSSKRLEADLPDPQQSYVATLSYEYVPSMTGKEQELLLNPLGYKVTAWRVDQELSTVSATPTTTLPEGTP